MRFLKSCTGCGAPAHQGSLCDNCRKWESDLRRFRRALGPAERQSAPVIRLVPSTPAPDGETHGR